MNIAHRSNGKLRLAVHGAGMLLAALLLAGRAPAQDVISTVAGGGPNGLPAVNADLGNPYQEAIDAAGNIYVADSYKHQIFKLSPTGILSLVAGTGVAGYSGDGGQAIEAQLYTPEAVAVDGASPANVYIADYNNCLVRRVSGSTGVITTVAGLVTTPATGKPYASCGYSGNGGKANAAELNGPDAVALNAATGDLYIADRNNGVIRKVAGGTAAGTISVVAGSGGSTTTGNNCGGAVPYGDTGAATSAYLCYPQGLTVDTSVSPVNLFISDYRCALREVVGATGKIYDVAGNYTCGFIDNVKATSGEFNQEYQTWVKVSGSTTTVSLADYGNVRIREFPLTYSANVPQPGTMLTIAGSGRGGYCGDDGPALSACMSPVGLVFDSAGDFYIGDYANNRVRKVAKSNGYITTAAGYSSYIYSNPVNLGSVPATALGLYQTTIAFADPNSSTVYFGGYGNQVVYSFNTTTGVAETFAGNGTAGYAGDGTAADGSGTELYYPWGVAKDSAGNVYIGDYDNCVIRKVTASSGDITTIAGGTANSRNGCAYTGDGGPATKAQLNAPAGLIVDQNGNLFVADRANCAIRKIVLSTGIITTVAGNKRCGFAGDGGPATAASLYEPVAVGVDGFGDLFIADAYNYRVREVDAFGNISTVAGNGSGGYSGDGSAIDNTVSEPTGIAVDVNGNIFISDQNNSILRWVDPAGIMVTFAGTPGSQGFGGDGGPATSAILYQPQQLSVDANENIYVADYYNNRVRKVTAFAGYGRSTDRLIFEKQQIGTTSGIEPIILSAIGPITISGISVSAGYGEIDDCVGQSLTAGQTCEIDVSFTPTKAGITDGLVTIASNAQFATQGSTVELVGEGGGLSLAGSLSFGTEIVGSTTTKTVTLSNTGAAAAALTKIYLNNTKNFSISGGTCPAAGGTLAASASCTIIVSYTAAAGTAYSTLVVVSKDPSSPQLSEASGTGTALTLSPTSLAFGSVGVDGTTTLDLTITNGAGSFTLTPSIAGSAFTILTTGNTCTAALGAGGKCTLPVQFTPAAAQAYTGTLTLAAGVAGSPTVALTGTGTVSVSATPTTIAFTAITHGTSETSNVTVKNSGNGSLTVTPAFGGSGAAAFSVSTTGNTCATAVAAGGSCTLPVKFAPAAAASYTATLTIGSNGGANPTVSLSGTGK